ncbi:MAG: hypothetical protein ACKN9V_09145 [Pseudomonadota bacterium]
MKRGIYLALILSLGVPGSVDAGCVRETLSLLAQKLSVRQTAEAPFKKYFENGDPKGWKKLLDDLEAKTSSRKSLGGNDGNTHSVTLPDGSSLVTKEFPSSELKDHKKIIQQLENWHREGKGPEVLGVSLLPGNKSGERSLFLVMEDLLAIKNKLGKKLLAGNGRDLRALRGESEPARRWLADRMLAILSTHPDPHPMNVIFRVTDLRPGNPLPKEGTYYLEGRKIYQAFLIDPSGGEGNPESHLFNTEISKTPWPLLQYNNEWKRDYFRKELDLK